MVKQLGNSSPLIQSKFGLVAQGRQFFSAYPSKGKQLSMNIDYNSAVFQKSFNKTMNKSMAKIALILLLAISLKCCEVGEFKDKNGKCQQCDISCYTCTSDGCKTCYDQMFTTTRGNSIICELCYNILKGCDVCLTSTKCQNCSAGYYLQADNTCSPCNNLFSNCLLCAYGNMTQCLGCQANYEPINGSCVSTSTEGRQPLPEFKASPAAPKPIASPSPTLTTLTTSPTTCDPSQVLLGGKCYPAIAFCLAYNQKNGSCISCISAFKQSNGYCLPGNLISNNGQLGQTQSATQDNSNGSGKDSVSCSSRQYQSDGHCFDVGPQCIEFDRSNGTCYLCATGFQIYNGLCIQLANNLQTNGATPSGSADHCGSVIANCAQVNPQNPSLCLVCCNGYTIVDSIPGVCYSIN